MYRADWIQGTFGFEVTERISTLRLCLLVEMILRNGRMRGTAREVGEACIMRPITESCKFSFTGQGRIQGVTKRRNWWSVLKILQCWSLPDRQTCQPWQIRMSLELGEGRELGIYILGSLAQPPFWPAIIEWQLWTASRGNSVVWDRPYSLQNHTLRLYIKSLWYTVQKPVFPKFVLYYIWILL
jgi:hypothetical protein